MVTSSASALPITWTVSDVVFDDGGTLNGIFVYDADANVYTDINLTTTAGTTLPGDVYGDPNPASPGHQGVLVAVLDDGLPLAGQTQLGLIWTTPLTNAGGSTSIDNIPTFTKEGILNGPLSVGAIRRYIVDAGTVTAAPPVVPETLYGHPRGPSAYSASV